MTRKFGSSYNRRSVTVEGAYGIRATVLRHSISPSDIELITYEVEYPRLMLAELNTHRAFSRASASSRAIPFNKMVENLHGRPTRFGKANPGMQDTGENYEAPVKIPGGETKVGTYAAWQLAKESAIGWSKAFYEAGYHKQVYNRLTEPFQMMKTVISATEWNNFFWLRNHEAADPTFEELASCMEEAKNESWPQTLGMGEWHLPYVNCEDYTGSQRFYIGNPGLEEHVQYITTEEAIIVSAARCAAVSFRNEDYGLEKCKQVYDRLVGDDRKHSSALEHQATPLLAAYGIYDKDDRFGVKKYISHFDTNLVPWSGNFKGWGQYRKSVAGENIPG